LSQFISLWDYFGKAFIPFQKLELPLKPLHKGVCDVMQRAALGELKKSFVVVNIPPRVGKTKLMEATITWMLAYFPESQFLYTSYSNDLAKTSVRYIQEVMSAQWYQRLFLTRLGSIRQADHFTTTDNGKVYGDGVGGSLTGLGAGLKRKAGGFIVVDDPSKPDEALSRVESDKLRFWFENTLKSRRNSSQWTPIIVCMQRLDPDDLSGFLLENYPEDVEHIKFPALINNESTIPETVDTKSLLDTQRVNPFAFAAQYMQEPIIIGGNLIKLENFRYYRYEEAPKFDFKVITCDTAMKAKEANDFTVLQCWGRTTKPEKRAYLIDQLRGKWSPDQLLKHAKVFYDKHHRSQSPVTYMSIEEAAAGYTLMTELRKKGVPARGVVRHKDKVTRVKDVLAYQATGMVYLPSGAPWLAAFEAECAQFREDGKQARDDQVDCLADGILICLGKATSILNVLGQSKRKAA
jgi:predicted phage terminase large subunit-like protein